jgi:hypothetical protein
MTHLRESWGVQVCMSVGQSLEGKRHAALTRLSSTVKEVRTP